MNHLAISMMHALAGKSDKYSLAIDLSSKDIAFMAGRLELHFIDENVGDKTFRKCTGFWVSFESLV